MMKDALRAVCLLLILAVTLIVAGCNPFVYPDPYDAPVSTILYDDFSGNLTTNWTPYGSPRPFIRTDMGNPAPSFDNNGDPMYDSGAISKMTFDYSGGLIMEADMYSDSDPAGCWVGANFGILKNYDYNDSKSAGYAVAFNLGYSGQLCNSKAGGVVSCLILKDDGTKEEHILAHYEGYQRAWHHFKIVIDPARHVHFYIDGSLFYQTTGRLSPNYNNMPMLLGNRSSHYGDALIDNVRVSPY
jgi:hypothetical protein